MTARVYRGTPRNLARLAHALQRGELVAVPTETVYGLAGDALSETACRRIFRAKGRPTNDPLIVHIHSLRQLDGLAERNDAVENIARAFWPGPLTIILPKKAAVPNLVTSGRPSVAIRMPKHPLFRALLRACGRPLAAPSANPFGYISPTTAQHVRDSLGRKIAHILDGGEADIGVESTILDLRDPRHPAILRPGAIAREDLERVLGVKIQTHAPSAETRTASTAALAPGMLSKHYSPRTPIALHERLTVEGIAGFSADEALLFTFKPVVPSGGKTRPTARSAKNLFWLSERGNLRKAAHTLFATLRRLDNGRWKKIHAELAPGSSALAVAINDRLTRAAAKR
jgi:L-threonylcarbamoyladenylate synthase